MRSNASRFLPFLLLLVAIVPRLLATTNEFWFDEIWGAAVAWEDDLTATLAKAHAENSHYLSILWMRLCGTASEFVLRLPSLLYAIGTLLLADFLTRKRSGLAQRVVGIFVWGCSYLAIQYSGEARGYSALIFHSLAALALDRVQASGRGSTRTSIIQAFNFILGVLSQPLFVLGIAASGLWATVELARRRLELKQYLIAFAPPALLVLLAMGLWGLPSTPVGPDASPWSMFMRFSGLCLGGPHISNTLGVALVAAVFLSTWRTTGSERTTTLSLTARDLLWFLLPPFLLWVRGTPVVYERYFLLALPVVLCRLSELAGSLWIRGGPARMITVALLALYGTGQMVAVLPYLRTGPGNFSSAIERMIDEWTGETVEVTSDNDLRGKLIFDYYWLTRKPRSSLDYVWGRDALERAPEWLVLHDLEDVPEFREPLIRVFGRNYRLDQHHAKYGLSGWHWFVYRKTD